MSLQRFFQQSSSVEAFQRYRGRWAEYRNDMSFILEQNYTYYKVIRPDDPPDNLKDRAVRRLRSARRSLIQRLRDEGKGFLETNHGFSSYAPLIREAYPEASLIHLVRHPKKVISSFMRKFDPPPMSLPAYFGTRFSLKGQMVLRFGHLERLADSEWCPSWLADTIRDLEHDRHLHPFERQGGRWVENRSMSAFEKTVWYWTRINELILDVTQDLSSDKYLFLRSENLFEGDDKTYSRLLDFVNPPDLGMEDLHTHYGTKTNPKSVRNQFPTADEWTPRMNAVLKNQAEDLLKRLGMASEVELDGDAA